MSKFKVAFIQGRKIEVLDNLELAVYQDGVLRIRQNGVEVTICGIRRPLIIEPRARFIPKPVKTTWKPKIKESIKLVPEMTKIVEKIVNHRMTHEEAQLAVAYELAREIREGLNRIDRKGVSR